MPLCEPVLTSTAVRASVSSITISPPEGRGTRRMKVCSIWRSMLKRSNIGISSLKRLTLFLERGEISLIDCRMVS